ncbi:unnamed protein product [Linum tenue]|uniref:Uncharacterized protein n=1 Tax=Linum tenue TaxID=586396 RepID=A0AAV0M8I7_9ROSI|nr:unnamed protein product [Linum tenue]
MDLFKVRKFRRARKPELEQESEGKPVTSPEVPKKDINGGGGGEELSKTNNAKSVDLVEEAEEDEDDDFITNEVKRRLKELRRNSFMALIPEEDSFPEQEEDDEENGGEAGDAICGEWRDVEAEGRQWWGGFDAVYDKYCDRMLCFDRLSILQLNENGCCTMPATPSPKSSSKKLPSPFRCLALKKFEDPEDETEHLQQPQNDQYHDLETAYVAQMCLTWEALHCQYTQLSQRISCQPENPTSYNHSAQQFQQFQVLLQRFIENEPFEQGLDGKDARELDSDSVVRAQDLIRVIESAILTFQLFVKMDKKKSNAGGITLFGNQNQIATPLQMIQSSIDKKKVRLKELCKKRKGWKKKTWPQTYEDVQLLFGLVDIKIVSRVLRMIRISKEQLIWCEDKMKKLNLADGKLQRDPSPILFPC